MASVVVISQPQPAMDSVYLEGNGPSIIAVAVAIPTLNNQRRDRDEQLGPVGSDNRSGHR